MPAGIAAFPRWLLLPPAHEYQSATHLLESSKASSVNVREIHALQIVCPDSESAVSWSIGNASSIKSVGPRHLGGGPPEPLMGSFREPRVYQLSTIF